MSCVSQGVVMIVILWREIYSYKGREGWIMH